MAASPKVSVVMTCFNYARFLEDAVDSVIAQSRQDYEVIIVNDGSTDDTKELAERLAARHPDRVRVINQPNTGASSARNNGIKASRGEYIVSLDGDDLILPDFLEKTVTLMEASPGISIVYTAMKLSGEMKEGVPSVITDKEYDFATLLCKNIIPSCNLFRKKAWEDAGGYKKLIGAEDWELWISMGEKGHRGKLLPEPLYVHRLHGRSKYSITSSRIIDVVAEVKKLHMSLYYPRLVKLGIKAPVLALIRISAARDRVAHWLYRDYPSLHSFLRRASLLLRGRFKEL